MGDKYKIKKTDLKAFFAMAEMSMENNYHDIFQKLGWRRGSGKNFHCPNEEAHSGGIDENPSVSLDNRNGQWHCFTCGKKGNFQSYWSEYLKGQNGYGDSYTDFVADIIGHDKAIQLSKDYDDPDFERNSRELRKLHEALSKRPTENGKPWMLNGELSKYIKEITTIPMKFLDEWVNNLLNNKEKMDYLYETRRINEKTIRKYRLGWFEHKGVSKKTGKPFSNWKYVFPMINAEGDLINIKAYDPQAEDPKYKWMHVFSGRGTLPMPINNFTQQKLYFFEGEPDVYCAAAFGYDGAVTLGSKSTCDVNEVFGKDHAKQLFNGKEIIICLDAEPDAQRSAKKLALSLYSYVKQIKIIDLNRSEINPNGLDPNLIKDIVTKKGTKKKRAEKDFTDFMKKNGFDEKAKKIFDELVEETPVFTNNKERKRKEVFKVTLQEARMARYFSSERSKELELVASVSDFNSNAYMYPTEFTISCRAMGENGKKIGSCKTCMLPDQPGFSSTDYMTFNFVRDGVKTGDRCIEINDHNILGLIEVTDNQKVRQIKKMCNINERCTWCSINDGKPEKLLHVRLAKDTNEFKEIKNETSEVGATADIDMEAYIQGDPDIYPSRSYKFNATQTTAWNGQHAVLFIHKAESIETSIETFKMTQDIHDLLNIFKPKDGESIKEHLERRYTVFSNAAGITGRKELFLINDLAYFSPIEVHNKMLPQVKRGWVEVLIAGDPRTCKTMISEFLHRHYKVGDIVSGSSSVSRAGLVAGITYFKNKPQISWGKVPMNDGGVIIIDELSEVDVSTLIDLTPIRSEGVAKMDKIKSGKVLARVRKIMLSNPRGWKEEEQKEYNYGIQFLRDLCLQDRVLARFDIAFVVRRGDVDVNNFDSKYEEISTEFTEYQCRHLIMWAYSRSADDVVFEKGFEESVNQIQKNMMDKYHPSTQLVNQEMRAKLIRLSISLATMLYSTVEDDWNKILVKKEHLNYIVEFLNNLYDHPNMKMDQYSAMKKNAETLGDMKFMMNISEYIDLNPLFREEEFTERAIHQIFYDYLHLVYKRRMYMPSAKSDKFMTTNIMVHEANQKLLGILTARNCLVRTKRNTYKKTPMFNSWLAERMKLGERAERSSILELVSNKNNSSIIEECSQDVDDDDGYQEQQTG